MSRSSAKAQVEPLPALIAVVAVGIGLSLYAGLLDARLPGDEDRSVAPAALERVSQRIAPAGVALPGRIPGSHAVGPAGYRTNVTLAVGDRRWSAGPAAPASVERASERVGVRTGPADVRPGRLTVAVWG